MLAALQAPIILMSQNRRAYKDRLIAEHDYEVNLRAELEIIGLHEKLDSLREKQWNELMAVQQEQMKLLSALPDHLKKDRRTPDYIILSGQLRAYGRKEPFSVNKHGTGRMFLR